MWSCKMKSMQLVLVTVFEKGVDWQDKTVFKEGQERCPPENIYTDVKEIWSPENNLGFTYVYKYEKNSVLRGVRVPVGFSCTGKARSNDFKLRRGRLQLGLKEKK